MLIRAKAPLRLSFAGGGTDVAPFPETEGGCVLSATVNLYSFATLAPRRGRGRQLRSADLDLSLDCAADAPMIYDGKLDLVKAAINRLGGPPGEGFDLFLHTDARPGSGLGSSSSLMVAVIGLLKEWRGLALSEYDVARLAWVLERQELGIQGGLQDQYAAAFGGWNLIEFGPSQVTVNPLRLSRDVLNELEHNLLLCFTGATRVSGHILEDQVARFRRRDRENLAGLRRQKALAVELKNLLLRRDLKSFGALLDEAWQYKKRISPHISNPRIDALYAAARQAGALGGKLNGAGGGGFMMFYCEFERRLEVARRLTALGCTVREFAFEERGLQTWRVLQDAAGGALTLPLAAAADATL